MIQITDNLEMTREEARDILARKSILQTNGCWEWTGSKAGEGYPQHYVGKDGGSNRYVNARRLVAAVALGRQVAEGKDVYMTCKQRACVNPDHLEEKTIGEIRSLLRGHRESANLEDRVQRQWDLFLELVRELDASDCTLGLGDLLERAEAV